MMGRFDGKRVFLSGPMTGLPDWNRTAFQAAENAAYEAGAELVFNPCFYAPIRRADALPHESYMALTLHALTRLDDAERFRMRYDAIAMLPGWERSEGAKVERAVAEACGIEVVEL